MRFEYEARNIAPMSWIAYVKDGIAKVVHGSSVCCKNKFFVEGAWNGIFAEGQFIHSNWFCGTGAELQTNSVVFSTPTHVTYGLFSVEIGGGIT